MGVTRTPLSAFRSEGVFCEARAVRIGDELAAALEVSAERRWITLAEMARGEITITARV